MGWPLVLMMSASLGAAKPADLGPAPALSRLTPADAQVVAKNIFLPSMGEVTRDTEPLVVIKPGEVILTGIIEETNPNRYVALLEDRKDKRSVFLAVGDELGPWKATEIEMNRLVVKNKDGTSQTVELGGALVATIPAPGPEPGPAGTEGPTVGPPGTRDAGSSGQTIEDILRERRRRESSSLGQGSDPAGRAPTPGPADRRRGSRRG